jgi:radical SAM protein with 4Fe4S-binding SPASM domain
VRKTEKEHKVLTREEWLTLIDETASIGVEYVIICLGKGISHFPALWDICHWAQSAHHTFVGLHLCEGALDAEARAELEKLDPKLTWLCLPVSDEAGRAYAAQRGITLCSSEVTEEDHTPPCDMPEQMVFVGPDGVLYTCGLVLGNDQFCLGKAMEKSLDAVFADDELPHTIPPDTDWARGRCNACPPIMVKRAFPDHKLD